MGAQSGELMFMGSLPFIAVESICFYRSESVGTVVPLLDVYNTLCDSECQNSDDHSQTCRGHSSFLDALCDYELARGIVPPNLLYNGLCRIDVHARWDA